MKQNAITFLFLLALATGVLGQKINESTVTSLGTNSTAGNIKLAASVGQIATSVKTGNNVKVHEGLYHYLPSTISVVPTTKSQTITFTQPATKTYGDATFTLGATSNSGLAVSYSLSNTTVASISTSGVVTILKVGTVEITASQTGNSTYSAASPVVRTLTVSPAKITVTADNARYLRFFRE